MIPKRRKPERMGLRTSPQVRCASHLAWVRKRECSVMGLRDHLCQGRIEAAHVRTGTDGGMGVKPSDFWTIPLCTEAHRVQHQMGEGPFSAKFGIDMRKIAEGLARLSPHRVKWMQP